MTAGAITSPPDRPIVCTHRRRRPSQVQNFEPAIFRRGRIVVSDHSADTRCLSLQSQALFLSDQGVGHGNLP